MTYIRNETGSLDALLPIQGHLLEEKLQAGYVWFVGLV